LPPTDSILDVSREFAGLEGLQIQLSKAVVTNCHVGDSGTRSRSNLQPTISSLGSNCVTWSGKSRLDFSARPTSRGCYRVMLTARIGLSAWQRTRWLYTPTGENPRHCSLAVFPPTGINYHLCYCRCCPPLLVIFNFHPFPVIQYFPIFHSFPVLPSLPSVFQVMLVCCCRFFNDLLFRGQAGFLKRSHEENC